MCPTKKSFFNTLGSGVSSLRDLSWETAAFEQQVRDTFVHFGNRMTSLVGPTTHPLKEYAREKPITALFVGFFVFACLFPIVSFITFALVTIGIGLAGFLFIEGTLLGVALFMLGSCLLTISFFAIGIGAVAFSIYYVVKTVRNKIGEVIYKIFPPIPVPVENGKVVVDDESLSSDNESLAHTD
jgi:hypothetical protein